jgi:hypothetical protein
MRTPIIKWENDFDNDIFVCKIGVPHGWLAEASHARRRLKLWWWLTKLAWSLPK